MRSSADTSGQNATGTLEVDLPAQNGQIAFQLASQDAGAVMRLLPIAPDKSGKPSFWQVTAGHGQATGSLGFSPAGYYRQLVAGYSVPQPNRGLVAHVPDYLSLLIVLVIGLGLLGVAIAQFARTE